MKLLRIIDTAAIRLVEKVTNPNSIKIFFKSIILYSLFKIVMLWPIASMLWVKPSGMPTSTLGRILFYPSTIFYQNIDLAIVITIILLVIALIINPNYFITIVFFWISLNLHRVHFLFNNGSDYVLLLMALWSVPLGIYPLSNNPKIKIGQVGLYNLAVWIIKFQVVIIYLVSGFDKIQSVEWRSGDAMAYVSRIDLMFNPVLYNFFQNDVVCFLISWATILFELLFGVLIWFKRTRLFVLAIGVMFHLAIWVVLSLPDFGIIMIVSYLIFLKDSDYDYLKQIFYKNRSTQLS